MKLFGLIVRFDGSRFLQEGFKQCLGGTHWSEMKWVSVYASFEAYQSRFRDYIQNLNFFNLLH